MINELDKVDFMGLDEVDSSRLILAISDHLDWQFEKGHSLLLQEKLNNYVNYILMKSCCLIFVRRWQIRFPMFR